MNCYQANWGDIMMRWGGTEKPLNEMKAKNLDLTPVNDKKNVNCGKGK